MERVFDHFSDNGIPIFPIHKEVLTPFIVIDGKKIPVTLHPLRGAHELSQKRLVHVDEERELVIAFPEGFTLPESAEIGEIEYEE